MTSVDSSVTIHRTMSSHWCNTAESSARDGPTRHKSKAAAAPGTVVLDAIVCPDAVGVWGQALAATGTAVDMQGAHIANTCTAACSPVIVAAGVPLPP